MRSCGRDFTSAHFLGLSPAVSSAGRLSTGRPAALLEPDTALETARDVAGWQGDDGAALSRTSFHALLDVLGTVPREREAALLIDRNCYPVARWAAAAAASDTERRIPMATFRHHDADDADRLARQLGRPVVVVIDGLCGGCLRPAPLAALAELAGRRGGTLVVDDSLAAGILGPQGRGSAAALAVAPRDRIWIASTAKGLAAPLGVISGSRAIVSAVRRHGPARMHTSPPTSCDIAALQANLADPSVAARRRRVAALAGELRRALAESGRPATGIEAPVVSVPERGFSALAVHRRLRARGLITLVTTGHDRSARRLTVCLRADHRDAEVERLAAALVAAIRQERTRP